MQRAPASWMKVIALVFMTVSSACTLASDRAGSVSFVIGDASVIGEGGESHPVTRGETVNTGQILITGPSGHIHLQMVDGAFISVRPQSRLRIEDYHYDAAVPSNNRIRFVLEQGVARSITGRAGETAKQNYRLNTPLAAIGIRGTDFVVQATSDVTRVTVQSGAVVMSPFAGDCLASALGPCKSAKARVLTAAMQNAYLELRSRNEAPLLVPAEKALESPNLLAPPRPEEPRTSSDKQSRVNVTDSHDAIREAAADTLKTRVDAATAPVDVIVSPVPPSPEARFWWGRWSSFIQPGQEGSSFIAAKLPGRELVVGNDVFALLGEKGTKDNSALPNAGIARFQLVDSEAYLMRDHKILTPAQVATPSLTVDFAARRYETALTVTGEGNASVPVQSSGKVTFQGLFSSDSSTPGTALNGALSRTGDQVGYVFQRDLPGGLSAVGATRWLH